MDVEKVFHMNGGINETSYAKNSSIQAKFASEAVKHTIMATLQEIYLRKTPNSLGIADLGCSTGHNSLSTIKGMINTIIETSHEISKLVPEFRVYLNDLPTNDFNVVFSALPEFYKDIHKGQVNGAPSIYVGAYPGSFYGRLFPKKSLHFVYSAFSLHWLSRVPPGIYDEQGKSINKASMYISESSPPQVQEAYYRQYQEDMSRFLRSRAEEVVDGGKMVLISTGRMGANHVDKGQYLFWELLSRSFRILVLQGVVEQEKLESFNMHFYIPSKEEFEDEVRKDDSFETESFEMFALPDRELTDGMTYGKTTALMVRAILESAINDHFKTKIIDKLFEHYARLIDEQMSKEKLKEIIFVAVLRKKI